MRFQSIIGFIINNNFKNFLKFENLFNNLIKFEIKNFLKINFESIIKLSSLKFKIETNFKEKINSIFKPYKIQFLNILFNQIFKEYITILIIKDLNIIIGIGNGITLKSCEIYAYINTLKNKDKIFKFIKNFAKKNKRSNTDRSNLILSVDDIFEYGDFYGVERVIKDTYLKKIIRHQLNHYLQNKEENSDSEIDYGDNEEEEEGELDDGDNEEEEEGELDDETTIDSNEGILFIDFENEIRNMNIKDEEFIEDEWNIKTDLKNDFIISTNENKYKIEFYDNKKKSIILKNVLYKGSVNINAKNKFYGIFNKFGLISKYNDYLTKSGYYLSECEINGKIFGIGLAPSKKIAQQRAAMRSIEMIKNLRDQNSSSVKFKKKQKS
ncbi:hypothetical protein B5S29_g1157 [[Candida] boidinii]|nr:hypothetical protein B5S29_g1157 [[Candida] boidinii]